jgi:hypothetical protein
MELLQAGLAGRMVLVLRLLNGDIKQADATVHSFTQPRRISHCKIRRFSQVDCHYGRFYQRCH